MVSTDIPHFVHTAKRSRILQIDLRRRTSCNSGFAFGVIAQRTASTSAFRAPPILIGPFWLDFTQSSTTLNRKSCMVDSIDKLFQPWDLAILVVGAILGAAISTRYSMRANRPRLVVNGCGSASSQDKCSWSLTITNRPEFLGQALDGETARSVAGHLKLNRKSAKSYLVYWRGSTLQTRVDIAPGESLSLQLFHWNSGSAGYFVADANGDPVARFDERETQFTLTLRDRLERATKVRLTVEFDNSHLQHSPELRIRTPLSMATRRSSIREGFQSIAAAFRLR